MRDARTLILLAFTVLAACACSGKEAQQPSAPPGAPAAAVAAGPVASTSQSRDLSSLKACEIVTGDEVAKIVGGKLATPAAAGSRGCMYVIEMPGGAGEGYTLRFEDAAVMEQLLKVQAAGEKGENITGPWDEAWLGKKPLGSGLRLWAVRGGDVAIDVGGDRKEPIIEIAKVAASRLR